MDYQALLRALREAIRLGDDKVLHSTSPEGTAARAAVIAELEKAPDTLLVSPPVIDGTEKGETRTPAEAWAQEVARVRADLHRSPYVWARTLLYLQGIYY